MRSMKDPVTALALAAAFIAIGAVGADKAAPLPGDRYDFIALDADMDGFVSMKEAGRVDALGEVFGALDTNQDERLGPVEFAKWSKAGNTRSALPQSPATGPSGSSGAQHMPREENYRL